MASVMGSFCSYVSCIYEYIRFDTVPRPSYQPALRHHLAALKPRYEPPRLFFLGLCDDARAARETSVDPGVDGSRGRRGPNHPRRNSAEIGGQHMQAM